MRIPTRRLERQITEVENIQHELQGQYNYYDQNDPKHSEIVDTVHARNVAGDLLSALRALLLRRQT